MLFGPSLCFKGGAYRKPWPCSVNEVEGESLCWEEVVRFDCSVEFEKVGADSEVISFIKGMGEVVQYRYVLIMYCYKIVEG